jgi:hypothetical protein
VEDLFSFVYSIVFRDDGSCKHCVALLFALHDFCERHQDRGTEACTDKPCKWDRPRQGSNPVTTQNIDIGKKDIRDSYQPFSENAVDLHLRPSRDNLMKSLYKVCKKHGSVLTYTMDPPSDDSDGENDINNNNILLPDAIQKYKSEHNVVDKQEFLEYLCEIHTPEILRNIEAITKEQSDDPLWFENRKGRITASVMGSVLRCNMERLNENNYIVKRIQSSSSFFPHKPPIMGKRWKMLLETNTGSNILNLIKKQKFQRQVCQFLLHALL